MVVGGQLHAPASLSSRKRRDAHCARGWVGARFDLDGCGKSRFHRDSIRGRSRRKRVAIPTTLFRPTWVWIVVVVVDREVDIYLFWKTIATSLLRIAWSPQCVSYDLWPLLFSTYRPIVSYGERKKRSVEEIQYGETQYLILFTKNCICLIKSRRMIWARNVLRMDSIRTGYLPITSLKGSPYSSLISTDNFS
jgi:hypothetical protein